MTAQNEHGVRGGLLRWLGFGNGEMARQPEAALAVEPDPADDDPRERHRRDLLTDIARFLISHRLEVSQFTLAVAHDLFTGCSPRLESMIAHRLEQREPITIDWLEENLKGQEANDDAAQLGKLVSKLESTITEFASTTTAARTATSDYNEALAAHVGDLGSVGDASSVILELAGLARDMLARTREIERELSRSERETRALHKRLADARREAEIDHLTGLPNRRAFEAVLEQEIETAKAAGEPICVAFCDIDHFKRINDSHGHEAGDRVLRTVARSLASISNDKCHVARHGGEEFVILLRGKSIDEAWTLLDAARETMASRKLINRATDMPFGRISFSGGISDLHAYPTARQALRAADDALYQAKSAGRNQILRAESATDAEPQVANA